MIELSKQQQEDLIKLINAKLNLQNQLKSVDTQIELMGEKLLRIEGVTEEDAKIEINTSDLSRVNIKLGGKDNG